VQHVALIPVFVRFEGFTLGIAVLQAMTYVGYSSFAMVIGLIAMQQAQAREEQRRLKTHLEASGFEVVLAGQVRGQGEGRHKVFKEKGVDVRIAVDMVAGACDGGASELIVASSDSDLQPAIHEVTKRGVRCVYLGFELNPNKGLTYTTGRAILIRNAEVLQFGRSTEGTRAV